MQIWAKVRDAHRASGQAINGDRQLCRDPFTLSLET